jgi:hypothetical protein
MEDAAPDSPSVADTSIIPILRASPNFQAPPSLTFSRSLVDVRPRGDPLARLPLKVASRLELKSLCRLHRFQVRRQPKSPVFGRDVSKRRRARLAFTWRAKKFARSRDVYGSKTVDTYISWLLDGKNHYIWQYRDGGLETIPNFFRND